VKATQAGRWGKVPALQRLLTCSFSGKALRTRTSAAWVLEGDFLAEIGRIIQANKQAKAGELITHLPRRSEAG
jgi:hypothetical protein